jgi:POLQ-like helicase
LKAEAKWAISSESRMRLDAVLALAQAERPIAELAEVLVERYDRWEENDLLASEDDEEPEVSDKAWNRILDSGDWPYPHHTKFEAELKQAAKRWFAARGYLVNPRQPYILDDWENWGRNIILPEVTEYIKGEIADRNRRGEGFALHRSVHHGLSSQALLFNLVGPLITSCDFEPLHAAFKKAGLPWPEGPWSATFEFEDRSIFSEYQGQPTSVDLVVRGTNNPPIFIECKLVEPEFGGCSVHKSGDCPGANPSRDPSLCYLHHIGRRYWVLMDKRGLIAGPVLTDSQCILASHYQFFRELLVALESGGLFVLLHDERSPTFSFPAPGGDYGLMPLLLRLLPEDVRHRVGIISIQQVVEHVKASSRHPWINDFEAKYGLLEAQDKS